MLPEIKVEVHGYEANKFSHFEGQVLTQIEALGLEEKQEVAFKSIIRSMIWKLWERPSYWEDKEPLPLVLRPEDIK